MNDRFGHFAADDVLIEFSHRIQRLLRTDDSFGRVGGEEFLAVLPRTSPRDAVGIGERLRAALCRKPFSVNGQPIVVTMSAGVTSFHPGETIDEAFARADRLLYDAKQSGRNKVISNITL